MAIPEEDFKKSEDKILVEGWLRKRVFGKVLGLLPSPRGFQPRRYFVLCETVELDTVCLREYGQPPSKGGTCESEVHLQHGVTWKDECLSDRKVKYMDFKVTKPNEEPVDVFLMAQSRDECLQWIEGINQGITRINTPREKVPQESLSMSTEQQARPLTVRVHSLDAPDAESHSDLANDQELFSTVESWFTSFWAMEPTPAPSTTATPRNQEAESSGPEPLKSAVAASAFELEALALVEVNSKPPESSPVEDLSEGTNKTGGGDDEDDEKTPVQWYETATCMVGTGFFLVVAGMAGGVLLCSGLACHTCAGSTLCAGTSASGSAATGASTGSASTALPSTAVLPTYDGGMVSIASNTAFLPTNPGDMVSIASANIAIAPTNPGGIITCA